MMYTYNSFIFRQKGTKMPDISRQDRSKTLTSQYKNILYIRNTEQNITV